MSIQVISTSNKGKNAMIVKHERDTDGVMRSTTHHVVDYKGQWQKTRQVEVAGKTHESVEVFE